VETSEGWRTERGKLALENIEKHLKGEYTLGVYPFNKKGYIKWIVCVSPDTPIITQTGPKPVSHITVGDKVLTHRARFRKVTKLFCRRINGKALKIRIFHFPFSLLVTPEHPILAVKRWWKYWYWRGHGSVRISKLDFTDKIQWVEAGKLEKGDFVAYPIDKEIVDAKSFDLTEFLHSPLPKTRRRLINRHKKTKIEVNNAFMRILGLFLADGTLDENRIRFHLSLHDEERGYVDQLVADVRDVFGLEPRVRPAKEKKMVFIEIGSKPVALFFKSLIGEEKQVPSWLMKLPYEKQRSFLDGFTKGDGWTQGNKIRVENTNVNMVFSLKDIGLRLGYVPSVYHDPPKTCIISGKRGNCRESYEVRFINPTRNGERGRRAWIKDGYAFYLIKSVEVVPYDGKVYNLEVEEDNSYCTISFTLHNCDLDFKGGQAVYEYMCKKFSQESTLMVDTGGKGTHIYTILQPTPLWQIANQIDQMEKELKIRLFPKQREWKNDIIGNFARLPLGKHHKTGNWSKIIKGDIWKVKPYVTCKYRIYDQYGDGNCTYSDGTIGYCQRELCPKLQNR
jgi:hypothetical protein